MFRDKRSIGIAVAVSIFLLGGFFIVHDHQMVTTRSYTKLTPNTAWQWQINEALAPDDEAILLKDRNPHKMIDIDMENNDAATIQRLKGKHLYVVCYLEVGAWEGYRQDARLFAADVKGKSLDPPYDNERYLDIRSALVKRLITQRFEAASQKGCQGIEPDIDDAYFEDFDGDYTATSTITGFPIRYNDQLAFNTYLAEQAHALGMSFGLKNGANQRFVHDLLPHIDWVLNEQCNESDTCGVYDQVIRAGKPVFQVEYDLSTDQFCGNDRKRNFDGLKKDPELAAEPRSSCR